MKKIFKTIKGWTIRIKKPNGINYIPHLKADQICGMSVRDKDFFFLAITEDLNPDDVVKLEELKEMLKEKGLEGYLKVVPCEIKFEI